MKWMARCKLGQIQQSYKLVVGEFGLGTEQLVNLLEGDFVVVNGLAPDFNDQVVAEEGRYEAGKAMTDSGTLGVHCQPVKLLQGSKQG